MKTKQILMTGALALSMVLSGGMLTGCSNSSNTKDTKTTEVAKKKEVKTIVSTHLITPRKFQVL